MDERRYGFISKRASTKPEVTPSVDGSLTSSERMLFPRQYGASAKVGVPCVPWDTSAISNFFEFALI